MVLGTHALWSPQIQPPHTTLERVPRADQRVCLKCHNHHVPCHLFFRPSFLLSLHWRMGTDISHTSSKIWYHWQGSVNLSKNLIWLSSKLFSSPTWPMLHLKQLAFSSPFFSTCHSFNSFLLQFNYPIWSFLQKSLINYYSMLYYSKERLAPKLAFVDRFHWIDTHWLRGWI